MKNPNEGKFQWNEAMREISGFGGSYEQACRAMISAGMEYLDARSDADPKFSEYSNIVGIINADNDEAKALEKHMVEACGDESPTGAMVHYSVNHVLKARELGWEAYVRMMVEMRMKEEVRQ